MSSGDLQYFVHKFGNVKRQKHQENGQRKQNIKVKK